MTQRSPGSLRFDQGEDATATPGRVELSMNEYIQSLVPGDCVREALVRMDMTLKDEKKPFARFYRCPNGTIETDMGELIAMIFADYTHECNEAKKAAMSPADRRARGLDD